MSKRRGNNEGSIVKLPSGSWRAQVSIEGKRLSATRKTRAEAQDWVREIRSQVGMGLTYDATQTKLTEFLATWLEAKRGTLAKNTQSLYARHIRLYITPYLGKYRLAEVTPVHIQNAYKKMLDHGVTVRPIQVAHAVLRGALGHATRLGMIAHNPAEAVIVPSKDKPEMQVWNESQVSQFLVSVKEHRNEYMYHLALATGMRRGELLGLQWNDVDWLGKKLRVSRQAIEPDGGGFEFGPPKTERGIRTIQVGDNVLSKLRLQQAKVTLLRQFAGSNWKENDLVFPSTVGTPQNGYNLSAEFRKLVEDAGLPRIRLHDLRHTAATLMLHYGIPPIVVSGILGHSKPSITTDLYGHYIPGHQGEAARLMDEITSPVEIDLRLDAPGSA